MNLSRPVAVAAVALAIATGPGEAGETDLTELLGYPPPQVAYFPEGALTEFREHWYGAHLCSMDEPPLPAMDRTAIRFTYLPSFRHPIVVRVTYQSDDRVELVARSTDGQGGYAPGQITLSETRTLDDAEVAMLEPIAAFLAKCAQPPDLRGMDGNMWIFEYQGPTGYCAVEEWHPRGGQWRRIGLHLLEAAGFDVETRRF